MALLPVALDYRPALLTSTGIGRTVRELARALARRDDVRLHLFGHSLARARHPSPEARDCRLHRLPIPGRSLPLLARVGVGADRLAGRTPLFHWTDYVHPPVSRATTVLSLYDVSFAEDSAFHGPEQARILSERTRRAARTSRLVLVPTTATANSAERYLGIGPEVLRVVPLGADHLPSAPGTDPLSGRPYVVALGTIEPRKNHLRILGAWRRLTEPRPTLVVIGRPGWECAEAVAALEEEEKGGDLIWLRGACDRLTFRYLAHARAVLYPSLLEGFGFPPLEAMSLGVPVLAGDTPALREVLGDSAVFCDPKNTDSVAESLDNILGNGEGRQRLIATARRRAASFTWDRTAEGYASAYREAMG